jgi:GTPase Era involved in 16S rRNA processing
MEGSIQQLVSEVAQVTGASLPDVLDDDAPVLRDEAIKPADSESFYLVGLIGGKEVGKSARVNALVGERISASTSFGPGTEDVVAYVHESQASPVRMLLEREAPGRFQIVTHTVSRLQRQALLDLPDVDSQYAEHVEVTRRMLRHMLFPIWIQSIEKYADQQPQKLLAAVAAGNDPENFLFCLNKADQIDAGAADELREDFAARIARTLGRAIAPKVFVISAARPDSFDLPQLRDRLSQQKSAGAVKQSIELAGKQRDRSMLTWIDQQRLPERVQRLIRLRREAEELTASRLSVPLMENVVPRLLDDPAHKAAIVDETMNARVARWPIVNVLHTFLAPLTGLCRRNIGAATTPEALFDAYATIQGRAIASTVSATFALLQQTHPAVGPLYRQRRLWDESPASNATEDLRGDLVSVLDRQRKEATARIARGGIIAPLIRWLLTIGAVLWFPIIQPVLELFLNDKLAQTLRGGLLLAVQLLGAAYLLKSAAFLAIWFLFLWLVLRWDTQRRVTKLLRRWQAIDGDAAPLSAPAAVLTWVDELLDPIRLAVEREESLVRRADELRHDRDKPAA